MITRARFLMISLFVVAALLTFFRVPVASSQGITIAATKVDGGLPQEDVSDAAWDQAAAVMVPLSAQIMTKPTLSQTNIKAVQVRALYNEEKIAFLVEWEDETVNDSTVRIQDFTDAVAIQFPLIDGQPFFCMGQQGSNVNIWHWKANWQSSLTARQDVDTVYPDMYVDQYTFAETVGNTMAAAEDYTDPNYLPAYAANNLFALYNRHSSVEDIVAGGFGTLTSQPLESQNVDGFGRWQDGKWRVIFTRSLASEEDYDILFTQGKVYPMAFAAWDGEKEERNGQKSTSQWVSLLLGMAVTQPVGAAEAPVPSTSGFPLILWVCIGGQALFLIVCAIIYLKLPE